MGGGEGDAVAELPVALRAMLRCGAEPARLRAACEIAEMTGGGDALTEVRARARARARFRVTVRPRWSRAVAC